MKYQCSYVFRPRGVIIRLALEHLKRLRSVAVYFFLYVHFDFLAVYSDVAAH